MAMLSFLFSSFPSRQVLALATSIRMARVSLSTQNVITTSTLSSVGFRRLAESQLNPPLNPERVLNETFRLAGPSIPYPIEYTGTRSTCLLPTAFSGI
uniref:Transcription factor bHLH94 n=1 Tax=Talaromyces marneffei PM1 TaxID=1077442 RepID=A0A093VV59_TALMA